jgi:hypothetical protein
VNASIVICPCCGKEDGLALLGRLPDDAEAQKHIYGREPCEACGAQFTEYKKIGFVIFVIKDEFDSIRRDKPKTPPWPFFYSAHVLKQEAAERIFKDVNFDLGFAFMPLAVAKQTGLVNEDGTVPEGVLNGKT